MRIEYLVSWVRPAVLQRDDQLFPRLTGFGDTR